MIPYLTTAPIKNGSTCLLRIDLNIESSKDLFRLESIIPTIEFLRKKKKRIVILSHRGRPQSLQGVLNFEYRVSEEDKRKYTLKPFTSILSKRIRERVQFLDVTNIGDIKYEIQKSESNIFLVENLRFWKEEEIDSVEFGKRLASIGDFYVNDAFAVSHRANASVSAITWFLPSYGGLLLKKEIENLDMVMRNPKHPLVILVGGAKVIDKVGVVKFFWKKADAFLFGGGSANTCLAARGIPVGNSLVDEKAFDDVRPYLASIKIHLPIDTETLDGKILDIGAETVSEYAKVIARAKTIIWNGPMGLFEKKKFSHGTEGIWKAILKNKKSTVIVGGGETIASLKLLGTTYKVPKNIFLSTGGGAMLVYLSGEKLPGITALEGESRQTRGALK